MAEIQNPLAITTWATPPIPARAGGDERAARMTSRERADPEWDPGPLATQRPGIVADDVQRLSGAGDFR